MYVVERFHQIMKPIIEEEKNKPKVMLPGQHKHYPNKDGPAFFYPPKNYRPTPIPRTKDLNLSEEQWEQFDGDVREGVVPFLAGFIKKLPQIYQSIPDAVIDLIVIAAEQIIESETESKDQEQLTNELERIVADGTDDNGIEDQFDNAINPKHFVNGNDGLRRNESWTQLQATVNGEANPEISITKISANIPLHNVNGSDGLGGNGCGTHLQATTNENGHSNHRAIDSTSNENNNKQDIDNRTEGNENKQRSNNENQHEQEIKLYDNRNIKLKGTGSLHTPHPEQELRNPNISQCKSQPLFITTPPEFCQFKWKVVITKQKIQPTNDHDTRSKAGYPKFILDKSFGSTNAKANSDPTNHFKPQYMRRKKADVAQVTEDKSAKRSKGNKTSAGSKKQ
ncbi:MAG: hypothetical protein EZS28_026291, partial [Streblomastix strix]